MHSTDYTYCRPDLLFEMVGDDRETFLQLSAIFERDSVGQLGKITQALEIRDLEQLGFHSHALKGTVGPLGADALIAHLIRIEDDSHKQDCQFAISVLPEIGRHLAGMREEVARFIAQLE